MKNIYYAVVIAIFLFSTLFAQSKNFKKETTPTIKESSSGVYGNAFSDFYFNVSHHDSTQKGNNAFQVRRIQFGYFNTFNSDVAVKLLLEGNNVALGGKMDVYLKQAFVEWKNISSHYLNISIGKFYTPAEVNAEKFWNYRSLEKTMMERVGLVSTTDMGFSLFGKSDQQGTMSYTVMVANGNGDLNEKDKNKKGYLSLNFVPMKGNLIELYADFENYGNGKNKLNAKLLYGMSSDKMSLGVEAFYGMYKKTSASNVDETPLGASLFTWMEVAKSMRVVVRGDYYDGDMKLKSSGTRDIYAIVGFDYMPVPEVHFIPNFVYMKYLNKVSGAAKVDDDMMVRLTAAFYLPTL